MRALILAAGFGVRLWPLTIDRTKPAIPVLNKPLIVYSLEYLQRHGLHDLIVNLHHQGDSVRAALQAYQAAAVNIDYSVETGEVLGTSGAWNPVRHLLDTDHFVVINGKIITDIDLTAAIAHHKATQALATLVLKPNFPRERFSEVLVTSSGQITGFGKFPPPIANFENLTAAERAAPPPLMFTGIQILHPRIFDYVPPTGFSHSTQQVYPAAIAAGEKVTAYVSNDHWYELSTLSRYLDISLKFLQQEGRDLVCGSGSVISPLAQVTASILWQNVQVEAGARLQRVIVGDGVKIPANTELQEVVIVRRELVPTVLRGEVQGDNVVVPLAEPSDNRWRQGLPS
jgi:NDP-sugar pyrophosphorylase family protein